MDNAFCDELWSMTFNIFNNMLYKDNQSLFFIRREFAIFKVLKVN